MIWYLYFEIGYKFLALFTINTHFGSIDRVFQCPSCAVLSWHSFNEWWLSDRFVGYFSFFHYGSLPYQSSTEYLCVPTLADFLLITPSIDPISLRYFQIETFYPFSKRLLLNHPYQAVCGIFRRLILDAIKNL